MAALPLIAALFGLMLMPAIASADFGYQLKWGQGNSVSCSSDPPVPPGPGEGEFNYPSGVAYFNGTVYVTDQGNNRVQKFTSDGQFLKMWGKNGGRCGESGTGNGEFSTPFGIATDNVGNVYVADADNNRIQKFDANGNFIDKWGANGGNGTSGSGNREFNGPYGIGIDKTNNDVYVADTVNRRIQKLSSSGNFVDKFFTAQTGDVAPSQPASVAIDPSGNLYVSDLAYHRIMKFNGSSNALITKWGSFGTGDGEFESPFSVAVDTHSNVYVADFNNDRIQEFDSAGQFTTKFGSVGSGDGEFSRPTGVGTDPFSNVYVADRLNQRIQKFGNASGTGTSQIVLGTTLTFQAGTGNANDVTITLSSGSYTITDTAAPISPGDQCTAVPGTDNSVTCPEVNLGGTVNLIRVELLDRTDRAVIDAPTNSVVDGGAENDVLSGGSGNDTIVGGGGTDAVDYSNAGSAVTVNLATPGGQNTIGAGTDTIQTTESLYGSPLSDTLAGDDGPNVLRGGTGNDVLDGGGGSQDTQDTVDYTNASSPVTVNLATTTLQDTIGAGSDTLTNFENLTGSPGGDNLTGDGNPNTLSGGLGDDTIDGAGGQNTASYAGSPAGVDVDLATTGLQDTGGAGSDTLTNLQNVTGSSHDDNLTGDSNANALNGGLGGDTLTGAAGNDSIQGGNGTDTADYSGASSGVTVDLTVSGAQNTGGAGSDTLSAVENVTGSSNGDGLTGDSSANVLAGNGGVDTLAGAAGDDVLRGGSSADTLNGGTGSRDSVDYSGAPSGVTVSLGESGAQSTGGGGSDTISNVEDITGSDHADVLTGNGGVNHINAGDGDDDVQVRDFTADKANCGLGSDAVTADFSDTLTACESASIAAPPSAGGNDPGAFDPGAPTITGLAATKVSIKLGGSFTFTLNKPATVKFTIEKLQLGRKVKKTCKKQTRKTRKKKICKYFKPIGAITKSGNTGANSFRFDGKMNSKPLKFGLYRMTAVAIDAVGNSSKPATTTFPVLR